MTPSCGRSLSFGQLENATVHGIARLTMGMNASTRKPFDTPVLSQIFQKGARKTKKKMTIQAMKTAKSVFLTSGSLHSTLGDHQFRERDSLAAQE